LNPCPKELWRDFLRAQTVIVAKSLFPEIQKANRHALRFCSFIIHGAGKAYRAHVHH